MLLPFCYDGLRIPDDDYLQRVVHCKSQYLLGIENPEMNKQFDIPAPLECGQPVRWNKDRTVRYFNPQWAEAPTHPINVAYFDAVHDGLIGDEEHMDEDKVSGTYCSDVLT